MIKKIAIIDDDPDILDALQLLFETEGYDTKTTGRGDETFQIVEKFKPDVLLLDVLLSGKDGRVICKQLKKDNTTSRIPIIMMSAHPHAKDSVMKVGADDFIPKPFDMNDMLRRVEKHTH